MPSNLDVHCDGRVTLVKVLLRELDHTNVHEIKGSLLEIANCVPGTRIYLDLARVRRMASAALGLIVIMNRRVRAASGELILEHANLAVCDLLRRVGLDRNIAVHAGTASEDTLPYPN